MWRYIRPSSRNLRIWQIGLLVLLFVIWYVLTKPGLTVMALVPNLRGAEAALAAGVHKLTIPVSASETHSMANVRKTRSQMVDEVARIAALRTRSAPSVLIEAGVSTAFGCTISGPVPEHEVMALAVDLAATGANDIGLSDTTGMANPIQVRRLFEKLRESIGDQSGAAQWSRSFGSATVAGERGLGIAADPAGNPLVVGIFSDPINFGNGISVTSAVDSLRGRAEAVTERSTLTCAPSNARSLAP